MATATASPPPSVAAMATAKLSLLRRNTTPSSHSSSSSLSFSRSHSSFFALSLPFSSKGPAFRVRVLSDVAQEEKPAVVEGERRDLARPCELYICNLPRSCDIAQLSEIFKPYGTVHSVEVSRDAETGVSRGCGFVTMSSAAEARTAIAALDGSDLGGREMRVKFSGDMISGRENAEALTTAPKLGLVFESPHKAYVGNLAWSVRPEDLRKHFSQFGTIVSTRVLYDRKGGKNRVYGFISFSSAEELTNAIGASGSEYSGRTLLVREVVNRK